MGLQRCWSDLTGDCWPRTSRSKPQHNGSNQSTSEPPSLLLAARLQLDITEGRKRSLPSLQRGLGRWPSVASRSDLSLSGSWSRPPSPPSWPASFTCCGPGKAPRVRDGFPFPAETLQLRNHHNLHPNSSLKISYTFDLAEFAEWLVGKKNVKQKKEKKNKATLSARFDLKTVSLLHSGFKGEGVTVGSNTSGRKCRLFRNLI